MKQRFCSGSVSIFYVLILVGLISVLFAFLEAARVSALKTNVHLLTGQAEDAVYASYQPELWEQYHLLFWEESGEGNTGTFPEVCNLQKDAVEQNWESQQFGHNFFFLQAHCSKVEVEQYQLATDDNGAGYYQQAANWMRQNIAEDVLKTVLQSVTESKTDGLEQRGELQEQEVFQALEQMDQSGKTAQTRELPEETGNQEQTRVLAEAQEIKEAEVDAGKTGENSRVELANRSDLQNPLEWMKAVKKNGVLALVMPEQNVSNKELGQTEGVNHTHSAKGSWQQEKTASVTDRLLFGLYCRAHFSDATQERGDRALDYEMEYLIGGKNADQENLKAVVNRLLLMREGANLLYLETDSTKSQEAMSVALALTSVVANPELAEPVKHAILAAWAYAESISDVRILLNGGKVSLVKNDTQWHTDLKHLGDALNTSEKNTEQEGLSYDGYLQLLLWTTSEEKIRQRSMNLIEQNTGVCMNQMAGKIKCSVEYEAQPLFWNLVQLGNNEIGSYHFAEDSEVCYAESKK